MVYGCKFLGHALTCTDRQTILSYRKFCKMNPALTDRAIEKTTNHSCSEKRSRDHQLTRWMRMMSRWVQNIIRGCLKAVCLWMRGKERDSLGLLTLKKVWREPTKRQQAVCNQWTIKILAVEQYIFEEEADQKKINNVISTIRRDGFNRKALWSTSDNWVTAKKYATESFKRVFLDISLRRELFRPATVSLAVKYMSGMCLLF